MADPITPLLKNPSFWKNVGAGQGNLLQRLWGGTTAVANPALGATAGYGISSGLHTPYAQDRLSDLGMGRIARNIPEPTFAAGLGTVAGSRHLIKASPWAGKGIAGPKPIINSGPGVGTNAFRDTTHDAVNAYHASPLAAYRASPDAGITTLPSLSEVWKNRSLIGTPLRAAAATGDKIKSLAMPMITAPIAAAAYGNEKGMDAGIEHIAHGNIDGNMPKTDQQAREMYRTALKGDVEPIMAAHTADINSKLTELRTQDAADVAKYKADLDKQHGANMAGTDKPPTPNGVNPAAAMLVGGGAAASSLKPTPPPPPKEPGFLDRIPNWGKALGAGALGLGGGMLAGHLLGGSHDDEDEVDENGMRKKKRSGSSWLGPALGVGGAAAGLGLATDWDYGKLLDKNWLGIDKGAAARMPMIMIPYRVKLADPLPANPEVDSLLDPTKAIKPPVPPAEPIPPAVSALPKPTLHPTNQFPQADATITNALGDTSQAANSQRIGQLVSGLQQHATQNPLGVATSAAHNVDKQWLSEGEPDLQAAFNKMPYENRQRGMGGILQHGDSDAFQHFQQVTGHKPPVLQEGSPELQNYQAAQQGAAPAALGGLGAVGGLSDAHTYTEKDGPQIAEKILPRHPEFKDPRVLESTGQQELHKLLTKGQQAGQAAGQAAVGASQPPDDPGIWAKVKALWNSLADPDGGISWRQILVAGGLGLGVVGMFNSFSGGGGEHGGAGSMMGPLMALGGLGAAAVGAGAFDENSTLRQMIGGRWGVNKTPVQQGQATGQLAGNTATGTTPPISTLNSADIRAKYLHNNSISAPNFEALKPVLDSGNVAEFSKLWGALSPSERQSAAAMIPLLRDANATAMLKQVQTAPGGAVTPPSPNQPGPTMAR